MALPSSVSFLAAATSVYSDQALINKTHRLLPALQQKTTLMCLYSSFYCRLVVKKYTFHSLQRQRFQQRALDFLFPGHVSQLWLRDPKVFPGQCRDIIWTWTWSFPEAPPSWMYLEHLHREATRRHPCRCPNHLNWLLTTHRSSSFTPRPSRTEPLTFPYKYRRSESGDGACWRNVTPHASASGRCSIQVTSHIG